MRTELIHSHVLFGKVKGSSAPVWYPFAEFLKHMLILGRTGSGKTNLIYWIVYQLSKKCGVWMFDRKEDFRHLLQLNKDMYVFDLMQDFCFNPLQPPPYFHPKKWVEMVTELYCRINSLLGVSQNMLFTACDKLFEDRGIYDGGRDYPSFFELYDALKKMILARWSRSAGSRDSLCNRFEATLATNKSLYDCSIGFDLESLLNKTVVFELAGLMETQANFWINLLLHWVFAYRIGKKERGSQLRNIVVFDEAKAVFSPFENPNLGLAPITYMVSMLREFGVGIIAADQTAQLNNSIFANSQLKILFSLGSGDDLLKAARSMGLDAEQAAYSHNLGVGEAIVRHHKIGKTFILQIPKFPLE